MASTTRVAIITGAANGIGKATAQRLSEDGFALFLVDQDSDGLSSTTAAIEPAGGEVACHVADVTKRADIEAAVEAAVTAFGRIDALANIAGGAGPRNLHQIEEIEDADWDLVMNLNLRSTFMACQAVVPIMRQQRHGRIVNMSSTLAHGRIGPVGTAGARLAYAAAKSGIIGFTHQLAKDVGEFGITANTVLPWLILSEPGSRIRTRFEQLDPAIKERTLALSPMRRPGEAREVAAAIAFLLSDAASFVSGVELPIDGAYLCG